MKNKIRIIYTLLTFLVLAFNSQAQVIPQGGFENWTGTTFEEPTGGWWTSLNSLKNLGGPITVSKTSDAQSGSWAAKLETKQWGTFLLPGLLVPGSFITSSPFILQGKPFTYKPVSFKGYYKYFPVNGDSAIIVAMLTRYNPVTHKKDTIAEAYELVKNQVSSYTAFDLTFNYKSTLSPDSVIIVLCSSAAGQNFQGQVGSTLYIDNLSFDYSNGLQEEIEVENVVVYPNPTKDKLKIEISQAENISEVEIINHIGQIALKIKYLKEEISLENLNTGVYYAILRNQNGEIIGTKKFIKL